VRIPPVLILSICLFASCDLFAQQEEYVSEKAKPVKLTEKQCRKAGKRAIKKCDKLTARVQKTTNAYLGIYEKAEDAMLHKICNFDERHAESLLNTGLYAHRRMNSTLERKASEPMHQRLPEFDSLQLATKYLEQNSKTQDTICNCNEMGDLKAAQQRLKAELKRFELVREHISDRVAYLGQLTDQYPALKASMPALQKPNYYLGAQTKEYLSLFSDRSGAEKKLFGLLNQLPGFKELGGAESLLAGIKPPAQQPAIDVGKLQSMEGAKDQLKAAADANGIKAPELLSNEKIKEWKKQAKEVKSITQDPAEYVQAQVENKLPEEVDELKENLPDSIAPPKHTKEKAEKEEKWKPNPLKTKRFMDRLTYGMNLQADPSTRFLPTTGSLAGQVSYKITTKMNIGIGASYMLAFANFNRTEEEKQQPFITTGGYTLRSYYDYKIKGPLYLQVNYELAYRHANQSLRAAMPFGEGKQAAMAGLKLKTPSSRKRQQTMEVLYDFRHRYTGQPAVVVRFGMEFLPKRGIR